jgi:hypothetical protein
MPHKDPRDPYVLPQVPEDDELFMSSALIVQHPRANVTFNPPPCTPESVAAAKAAQQREREAIGYQPVPAASDAVAQIEAREMLRALVRTHGADRIVRWARFEGWIAGQDVEL